RVEAEMAADVVRWRASRDRVAVTRALDELSRAAESDKQCNLMPATLALAVAGGTTGEWAGALRRVWGEYRAPTGLRATVRAPRERVALANRPEGPPRLLVAKPGLDGHSNGAEQIAVAARDAGFEVVYQGIRQSAAQIAATARDEDVDLVGLSILSGSHLELVPAVQTALAEAGVDAPVVVGGIIPPEDADALRAGGVAAVYTPRDFQLSRIVADLAALVDAPSSSTIRPQGGDN
ncbi:MAG: protein meaA, partial [Acidimicrobiaceae bacterium]|nr:protein meaA [Acidimicrobiaceae bacterium]